MSGLHLIADNLQDPHCVCAEFQSLVAFDAPESGDKHQDDHWPWSAVDTALKCKSLFGCYLKALTACKGLEAEWDADACASPMEQVPSTERTAL